MQPFTGYDQQMQFSPNVGFQLSPKPQISSPSGMLGSLFVPWLFFAVLTGALSFSTHYESPLLCKTLVTFGIVFVCLLGYFAYIAWCRQQTEGWHVFLFVTSLIALVAAIIVGSLIFNRSMRPYYDVVNLNTYPNIDPRLYRGQQLMDMGRVTFTPDTRLDLSKSIGFRNLDVYCVAPIISGSGNMSRYDFWGVGTNCCSGHSADFACGEFNNPLAHSGLRLMRDDLRPFFRLAVQQAEAAYNIKSGHPIFLYFMQDPVAEIVAYQDEGYRCYIYAISSMFAIQLFLIIAVTLLKAKGS